MAAARAPAIAPPGLEPKAAGGRVAGTAPARASDGHLTRWPFCPLEAEKNLKMTGERDRSAKAKGAQTQE
jgi:hypothetical protein